MKIVCRCQDITEEEVLSAIRQGATTLDEIKRLVRAGMGPCQGRTCRRLVQQIISRELKKPMAEIHPSTFRPPNLPVPFNLVMAEYEKIEKEKERKTVRKPSAKGKGKAKEGDA
ncbi:MAG TPA: (2Fe-2S)-binding protein [Candidatus Ozemobacteraceae bacterium]|nr:(2Fe-2S)-binding protein [Candidatus Ozemobacteraceae bacterium]